MKSGVVRTDCVQSDNAACLETLITTVESAETMTNNGDCARKDIMNLPQDKYLISKLTNLPFLMAHELCHYTVARTLGMRAKLGLAHVSFRPDNPHSWKMFLVMLAPALAGVVGLIFLIGLAIIRERPLAIWLSLFLTVCWWAMCLDDFYCVWYYIKHKTWPRSLQKKPKPGLAGIKMLAEWRPWEENAGQ